MASTSKNIYKTKKKVFKRGRRTINSKKRFGKITVERMKV